MFSFQIYQDDDIKQETSSSDIPTIAKNAKHPLGWRNTNTIVHNQHGNVPAPFVKKELTSREVELRQWVADVRKAEKNRNQMVGLTQQFEAISIPEEHEVDLDVTSMIVSRSMMLKLTAINERYAEHQDHSINADTSMSPGYQRYINGLLDSSRESKDSSMREKSFDNEESFERYQEDSINEKDTSMSSDCQRNNSDLLDSSMMDSINAEDTSMFSDNVEDSINEEDTSMSSDRQRNNSDLLDSSMMENLCSDADESFERKEDSIYVKDTAMFSDRQRVLEGVQQYQKDILAASREAEMRQRPKAHYMFRQERITYTMRSVLIDWLVAVAEEYQLATETLYLSVAYIDRYLGKVAATRSNLQLVGITALFLASKYEEINHPRVREFIYITCNSYSRRELLSEEKLMVKVLSFDLMTPTAFAFINMYALMCGDMTNRLKFLTLYISELSLLNGEPFHLYLPSQISAAALALARYTLGMEMWSPQLEELTTYKMENLRTVILALSYTLSTAKQLKTITIQTKYRADKYENVADIEVKGLTKLQFEGLN